jgi:hypothetical protein
LLILLDILFLERTMQVLFGEDRKSRSSDCFSVVASLNVHGFDLAFAYDVISILLVVFFFFFNLLYLDIIESL